MSTDSTTGARDHARSQVRTATMRIPATPPDVDPSHLLWAEAVPRGSYATRVLGRGTRLRLVDPDGRACAHLLLFRSDAPWERLNVADTVKVPWQAYLGRATRCCPIRAGCWRPWSPTAPAATTRCAA